MVTRLMTMLAAGALCMGCGSSSPVAPASGVFQKGAGSDFTVAWQPDALMLVNTSGAPLRVSVLETSYLQTLLASWCFGASGCGTAVEPGQPLVLRFADIPGSGAKDTLSVVYWSPGPDPVVRELVVSRTD